MSNRLAKYLFVYDEQTGGFPERWLIVRGGDPSDISEAAELTGTLNKAHLDDMTEQLRWTYPKPRYDVSTASANSWGAIRNNYRGLRDHHEIPGIDGSQTAPPAKHPRSRRRDRMPSRRDSASADRSTTSGFRDRWIKLLLALYLLSALIGATILVRAFAALPAETPRLELGDDQDVRAGARRLRDWVFAEVPVAADWLAPMGLFNFEDDLRSVLTPNDWERDNTSLTERVERLNLSIKSIREDYLNAASLLGVIFFGGFFAACITFAKPDLGTAFAICLFPLFTTPIATEPLIGVDNMPLFYLTLPMLITGGGVLLIESVRAIGTSIDGPRSDAWMRVWVGLWMIVVGAAATAVSALLSEAVNAGIMMVAVGPVLYGVFSVFWGLAGMFKRRGERILK